MKKLRKAIFPVGGLGTRFLPATKSMPKEMLPVASKPLIQYAFEEARAAGIEQFIFIMGRNKNIISNHFDHSYELQSFLNEKEKARELDMVKGWLPQAGHIAFIRQQEPLGLGHAVWCARDLIGDEPFAVLLADEMLHDGGAFLSQMVKAHNATKANMVAVQEIPEDHVSKYGIIAPGKMLNGVMEIHDMVEKPEQGHAPSRFANIGRYILNPSILNYLERTAKGRGGEIQLTDAMRAHLQEDTYHAALYEGRRYDCGSPLGFLEANIAYAMDDESQKAAICDMLEKYTARHHV